MKKALFQNNVIFMLIAVAITASIVGSVALWANSNENLTTNDSVIPEAYSQEINSLSRNNPTIKVTGSASMVVEPEQAVIIVTSRSQPTDISTALEQKDQVMQKITDAVTQAIGKQDDETKIKQGHFNLDQYYRGEESYSNIDTFVIRSTTSVETGIDQFSEVVKKLTDEGYTFESVHAYRGFAFASTASGWAGADEGGIITEEIKDAQEETNQITLNIVVSTKPDSINEVVKDYEEKHQRLLEILTKEIGIENDKIQSANVNIDPLYYGPINQNSLYNVYSQVFIQTEPKNIEPIVSSIKQHDVFVDNIMITVSDETLSEAEDELNLSAFNNAKEKAKKIAQMTGLRIGGVQSIESITEPMEQRRTFHGNLYEVDSWRYRDSGEVGVAVTVEFVLTR